MAKEAKTEAKAGEKTDWNELVGFYAFKDQDKYKDDIFACVNGKAYKIKRGVNVMIPRNVYNVIMRSARQDAKTADLIDAQNRAYEAEARRI